MKSTLVILSCLLLSFNSFAQSDSKKVEAKKKPAAPSFKEVKGVKFPSTKNVAGQDLVLNGVGMRKAYFTVKVYVAGLYLSEKSSDVESIVKNDKVKKVEMQFLMGVKRSQLTDAWKKALLNHCPTDCTNVKDGLAKMNSYMTSVVKGERFEFTIFKDKVLINIKGEDKPEILGKEFAEAMVRIYVGDKAIDSGLAKGLRGLDD